MRRKQARHGHHVARRRNEGWRAPPHGRSSLQFLVELQAFLTLVGNTTLAFAAVRIALSNGWTFNDLNPLANGNPFDQSLKEEEPAAQSELPVLQVRRPASHAATRDACRRRARTRHLATARPHAPRAYFELRRGVPRSIRSLPTRLISLGRRRPLIMTFCSPPSSSDSHLAPRMLSSDRFLSMRRPPTDRHYYFPPLVGFFHHQICHSYRCQPAPHTTDHRPEIHRVGTANSRSVGLTAPHWCQPYRRGADGGASPRLRCLRLPADGRCRAVVVHVPLKVTGIALRIARSPRERLNTGGSCVVVGHLCPRVMLMYVISHMAC